MANVLVRSGTVAGVAGEMVPGMSIFSVRIADVFRP